jgi:hypothetical protein
MLKWGYLGKINGRCIPLTLRGVKLLNDIMGLPFSSGKLPLVEREFPLPRGEGSLLISGCDIVDYPLWEE